jgi:hypothetical protein
MKTGLMMSTALFCFCGCAAGPRAEPDVPEPPAWAARDPLPPGVSTPWERHATPQETVAPTTCGAVGGDDACAVVLAGEQFEDTDPAALTEFRQVLAPYGTWEEDPRHGTVWFPARAIVGADFTPYATNGHWTYNREYVWVSDYEWGWAPFHYGRWVFTGARGWAWIAGRKYAGAWVVWRTGEHEGRPYVAWGPSPASWLWHGTNAIRIEPNPAAAIVVCPTSELFAPDLTAHLVTVPRVFEVAARTRPYYATLSPFAVRLLEGIEGPTPRELGIMPASVVPPPITDAGLQRAWVLARRSTAVAVGARPMLPTPARFKTFAAGAPRYIPSR